MVSGEGFISIWRFVNGSCRLGFIMIHRMMTNVSVRANVRSGGCQVRQTSFLGANFLPLSATINTSHTSTMLAALPLIETFFVEVLPASSLAPNQLLLSWFHWEDADGTIAFNGLASTIVHRFAVILFVIEFGGASDWSIGED